MLLDGSAKPWSVCESIIRSASLAERHGGGVNTNLSAVAPLFKSRRHLVGTRQFARRPPTAATVPLGRGSLGLSILSLKIAFFDDRFHEVYGAQENLLLLAQLAGERGHRAVLFTTAEGALADEGRSRGLETVIVEAPTSLRRFEGTTLSGGLRSRAILAVDLLRYNARVAAALRQEAPDLVVSAAVRPSSLLFGSRLRNRRCAHVVYAQNSIPRGLLAAAVGVASRRVWLIGAGARPTFPDWFLQRFGGRLRPLPSGRDLSSFEVPGRTWSSPLNVVTVSSLTPRKGIHVLIDALAEVRKAGHRVGLTVVGGATESLAEHYATGLVRQADELGLTVDFVGWQDDVRPFLADAQIFALASEHEGLPGVLIEAMAAGLPCVTTRAGSAGDLIDDAGAGFSVEIGDVAGLASALGQLCASPHLRSTFGAQGALHVRAELSLSALGDRFDALIADATEDRR